MATKIVTKNSSTASAVPTASDLVQGELAVNVADKRLFTEDNAGAIVELGTNPSGNVTFQDNGKAIFGAGDDLQVYHDGSNSYVKDVGTGTLNLQGSTQVLIAGANGTVGVQFIEGAGVNLRHNNSQKLATTSSGIDVTGTATMDGLTVETSADPALITLRHTGNTSGLIIKNFSGGEAQLVNVDNGPMVFKTNDTERMRIDSSGNVGIGNTVASSMDGGANNLVIGSGSGTEGMTIYSGTTNSGTVYFADGASGDDRFRGQINYAHSDNSLNFRTNASSTPQMTLDSSGNVGIGTSSPSEKLQVDGNIRIGDTATGTNDDEEYSITSGGQLIISANDSAADVSYSGLILNAGKAGGAAASSSLVMIKTNDAERMRIESSGTVKISHADTASEGFRVIQTTAARTSGGALGLFYDDQAGTTQPTLAVQQNGTGDILQLFDGGSQVVTVKDGGNVGIGTSSPAYKLDLNGDMRFTSSSALFWGDTNVYEGRTGNDRFWVTGGSERMRIDSSGATLVNTTSKTNSGTRLGVWAESGSVAIETRCKTNVSYFPLANYSSTGSYIGGINATTTATSLATSSDQRLKENITDADDAGSKIDAIQVRQYDWKADGSHQDYGMIAQELREIIPNVIHESPDEEKMLSVDYAGLVPMLIKEIQSLRNRVAQLEE